MSKPKYDIQLNIGFLDFTFQNEFRGLFIDYKEVINILDIYLTCLKSDRWTENFLTIGIRYGSTVDLSIERTFYSNKDSSYRYIERQEDKKIILDLEDISKEKILNRIKQVFEDLDK